MIQLSNKKVQRLQKYITRCNITTVHGTEQNKNNIRTIALHRDLRELYGIEPTKTKMQNSSFNSPLMPVRSERK